jgi:hypothetical protein
MPTPAATATVRNMNPGDNVGTTKYGIEAITDEIMMYIKTSTTLSPKY